MDNKKEIRAGILRVNMFVLSGFISKFFTGELKFVNKNLRLRNVRKSDSRDMPGLMELHYYDFVFEGDDLPIVPYGCWPLFITEEKVEGKKNLLKLVKDNRDIY